jgi:hypothetical protein
VSRTITFAGYAVIALAMVVAELVARRSGRVPTAGQALDVLRGRPVGRALLLAGWLWLGLHTFVRSDAGW